MLVSNRHGPPVLGCKPLPVSFAVLGTCLDVHMLTNYACRVTDLLCLVVALLSKHAGLSCTCLAA